MRSSARGNQPETVENKREWMGILFGKEVLKSIDFSCIRNCFYLFKETLGTYLILNESPTDLIYCLDVSETRRKVSKYYNQNIRPLPIIILIDDAERSEFSIQDELAQQVRNFAYILKVTGSELLSMVQTNDFSEFGNWCEEFVEVVMVDVDLAEIQVRKAHVLKDDSQKNRSELYYSETMEPGGESMHAVDIESILEVIDQHNGMNYNDFVFMIAIEKFHNRIELMFSYFLDNVQLLKILRIVFDVRDHITTRTETLLNEVLNTMVKTEFIMKMCKEIETEIFNGDVSIEVLWWCLEDIMYIFLSLKMFLNDMIPVRAIKISWDIYCDFLHIIPDGFWKEIPEHLIEWLKNKVDTYTGEEHHPKQYRKQEHQHVLNDNIPNRTINNRTHEERPNNIPKTRRVVNVWEECENRPPPNDFRVINEIPCKADILAIEPPYLRRAIIDSSYKNSNHYLDVVFRLTREDLLSPLRDGLHVYRSNGSTRWNSSSEGATSTIAIYQVNKIRGIQIKFQDGLEFRYVSISNINYEERGTNNRSLMFGQIVCLSNDNFVEDLNLALIVERSEQDGLMLGLSFFERFTPDDSKSYILAEPASYLEAYQHVLKVFKGVSRFRSFPMERYIVYGKTNMYKPLYMRVKGDPGFEDSDDPDIKSFYVEMRSSTEQRLCCTVIDDPDFNVQKVKFILETAQPIFPKRQAAVNEQDKKNIKIYGELYDIETLEQKFRSDNLDPSQRTAMISALTQELSLIQGPPGTGKTFIGVEIVRTILANRVRFSNIKPILVVCYTNAALDQFLEKLYSKICQDCDNKIIKHEGPIAVRLGSKSESNFLDSMRLMKQQVVSDYKFQLAENENGKLGKCFGQKRAQAKELCTFNAIIKNSQTKLLCFEIIKQVMSSSHLQQFTQYHQTMCSGFNKDEAFAYWLLDKSVEPNTTKSMKAFAENKDDNDFEKRTLQNADSVDEEMSLEQLFANLNMSCQSTKLDADQSEPEKSDYETDFNWDLEEQVSQYSVELFGKKFEHRKQIDYDPYIVEITTEMEPHIMKTIPLSLAESNDITSILTITKVRRWELYNFWAKTLRTLVVSKFPTEIEKFKTVCRETNNAQIALDVKVLERSLIIGATTTGAAKAHDMLQKIGCKVLVVEESAEIFEAHNFAGITQSIEHVVLIGDHQQLRPNPSVYELAKHYNLNISMFERLILNKMPYNTLLTQHRMNPIITSTMIKPYFYQNLQDHSSVSEYPPVVGMEKSLYFWSHKGQESFVGNSFVNNHEVEMVLSLLRYILKQNAYSPPEISVLTAYSEQHSLLKNAIEHSFGSSSEIVVETIDSYQGKENTIVIVSLVRSFGDTIGFLAIPNRVCVALTRAKHGLYIIGNIHHLQAKSNLWANIMNSLLTQDMVQFFIPLKCRTHGFITEIYDPKDFQELAPDGGCKEICGSVLDCGHTCQRKCHPGSDHLEDGVCRLRCLKVCENSKYNHQCGNNCGEVCGKCYQLESVTLSCGHKAYGACYSLLNLKCKERCSKHLKCGHQCAMKCGEECTTECLELMPFSQPCGHVAQYLCSNPEVGNCTYACSVILSCGHECQNFCSQPCTDMCLQLVERYLPCGHLAKIPCSSSADNYPCPIPVEIFSESCGHTISSICSADPQTLFCSARCLQPLDCKHFCNRQCGICKKEEKHVCDEICSIPMKCGHPCLDRCGIPCGPCKADCLTSCTHQSCGSTSVTCKTGISFGRLCSEICVLCSRSCDNYCEHRGCTLTCWEVCDVKPCEVLCSKKLPCGHACLGMCNEACPTVCGSCNQKKYLEIVNVLNEFYTKTRVYRLLSLPACGHTFPVQYLDEIFTDCKQNLVWPRCPAQGCGRAIVGVLRYSRIIKEIVLKHYQIAEKKRTLKNPILKTYNFEKYKAELKECFKTIDKAVLVSKVRKRRHEMLKPIREIWLGSALPSFLFDINRSFSAFSHLYLLYVGLIEKLPNKMTFGPNLQRVCGFLASGSIKSSLDDLLDTIINWFIKQMNIGVSGVFMPTMNNLLYKLAVYLIICKLIVICLRKDIDLDVAQAQRLSTLSARVRDTGSNHRIDDLLNKIIDFIRSCKLLEEKDMSEWKQFFETPFPKY